MVTGGAGMQVKMLEGIKEVCKKEGFSVRHNVVNEYIITKRWNPFIRAKMNLYPPGTIVIIAPKSQSVFSIFKNVGERIIEELGYAVEMN